MEKTYNNNSCDARVRAYKMAKPWSNVKKKPEKTQNYSQKKF